VLDALSALPEATLEGAFVVGDDLKADRGVAQCLSLPFVEAHEFRTCSVEDLLPQHQAANPRPYLSADRVAGVLVGTLKRSPHACWSTAPLTIYCAEVISQVHRKLGAAISLRRRTQSGRI